MKVTCGIYLFRSDNKMLIGHPTKHKSNIWSIPKGRMDEGENDYFDVAKRELLEETNINLDKYKIERKKEFDSVQFKENRCLKAFFIKVNSDFSDSDIKCTSMVYRKINGVDTPVFPEFDEFRWVTIEEAKEVLRPFQHDQLDKCGKYLTEGRYKFKFIRPFFESQEIYKINDNNRQPKVISANEFNSFAISNVAESWTNDEYDYLSDLRLYNILSDFDEYTIVEHAFVLTPSTNDIMGMINIMKYEDSWYLVRYIDYGTNSKHWLCDEFDEVKYLMESMRSKKSNF